jgi:hypothetical protein
VALAGPPGPDWVTPVKKIPTTRYTKDARTYVGDPARALKPLLTDKLGNERLDPVLADVGTRYFDGARLLSTKDGGATFENLKKLDSHLKSRLTGHKVGVGPEGVLAGVHWHFFAHSRFDSIGPSAALLDCLRTHRIPFTIHPPTG